MLYYSIVVSFPVSEMEYLPTTSWNKMSANLVETLIKNKSTATMTISFYFLLINVIKVIHAYER